jgi:hypothetical protein
VFTGGHLPREFAGQADEDSRLPEASAAALTDSGMFRLGVPLSFAGVPGRSAGML